MKHKNLLATALIMIAFFNIALHSQTDLQSLRGLSSTQPLSINVTIGGSFIVTGSFPASMNERVDQFVTRIYLQGKDGLLKLSQSEGMLANLQRQLDYFGLRDIKLQRTSGETLKIDLQKFRINGDFKNNPYLKNDDVLIFAALDLERNYFVIQGAVNSPGKFQFAPGDKLSDAIELAMGINPAYENVRSAVISRLSYDGEKEELLTYNIEANPILKIGDRITVVAEETQKRNFNVVVRGEVHNPGFIPITKNNTTLREVIKKAGGFNNNADLNRAEIVRGVNVFKDILFTEEFENLMMMRMAKISAEDSLSFILDNKLRFARGNGIINFFEVMDEKSVEGDFIVKDGDIINVPEKVNLVYVFGQAQRPGYVLYEKGQPYTYYIEKAGGRGEMAKDETYVIKGKSRTWVEVSEDHKIELEPGDYIWIPKEVYRTFTYYMDRIQGYSTVIGTIATLLLLITQLSK